MTPAAQRAERDAVRPKRRVWVMRDVRGHWAVWLFSPGNSRFVTSDPDWPRAIEFAQFFARTYATKHLIR